MKKRIELIDALRGLAVILMVLHHFFFDLVEFLNAPYWLFSNPVFDFLHYIFAGCFILLSGVSSNFSRSNVKRGLKTGAAALLITAVTYVIGLPIIFGILHFFAVAMILYGLSEKVLTKIPRIPAMTGCVLLLILSLYFLKVNTIDSHFLWMFGITYEGFYSSDYFPLLPWIFVFLFGTYLGGYIKDGKFPKWFYDIKVPVLPEVGRHSFIIYLLHQPVLYGITMLLKFIL